MKIMNNKQRESLTAPRVREALHISFGEQEHCRKLLWNALQLVDKTNRMQWLPEYEKVALWMSNNKGKGLLLTGDCGRGKTNIIAFALPYLFANYKCMPKQTAGKILIPVHIDQLDNAMKEGMTKRLFYVVDEVGAEALTTDYGSKYFPFMKLMNAAEEQLKFCLLSSNLTANQLYDKYDLRTLERVNRLCHPIRFEGKSMRK